MAGRQIFTAAILAACLGMTASADAAAYRVSSGQSLAIDARGVTRASVADPNCADVVEAGNELVIIGKKTGVTTLYLWHGDSYTRNDIYVSGNNEALAELISEELGLPDVKVAVIGGKVVLKGSVLDQSEYRIAQSVAAGYGQVINMLEMSQAKQVKVEARIVEISSSKARELGMTIGSAGDLNSMSHGTFRAGQGAENKLYPDRPLRWFGSYQNINAQLNLLVSRGDAKVLSQPYIITMSGKKANTFIGGQIPIPISDDGERSIEWRDYGIKLEIEPTVQDNGQISSVIKTEVSSLDRSNGVVDEGYNIPGLATRTAETTVMMKPGMTMAIGGLISSEESRNINKIPLLGDIPVLGHFFRSTSKSHQKKEIIILITPIVVDSGYKPVMSSAAERVVGAADSDVLGTDVFEAPKPEKAKKKPAASSPRIAPKTEIKPIELAPVCDDDFGHVSKEEMAELEHRLKSGRKRL